MGYHSRQRGRLRPPLFFCASGGRPGACRRYSTPRFGPVCVPGHAKRPQSTPLTARAGPIRPMLYQGHSPRFARAGPTKAHTPTWTAPLQLGARDQPAGGWPGRARPLVTVCRCRSPTPPSGPNSPRGPEPTHTPLECALILENCGWARL